MSMPGSQFYSQQQPVILLLVVIPFLAAGAEAQGGGGCLHKCGDMDIPFPFGIGVGPGCFREGFEVVCNHSSDPPCAFLADKKTFKAEAYFNDSQSYGNSSRWSPLELVNISVATGEARACAAVAYRCSTNYNESFSRRQHMDFSDTPFAVSAMRNALIGVGSEAEAELTWSVAYSWNSFTCHAEDGLSSRPHFRNGSCTGWGCCEHTIPPDEGSVKYLELSVNPVDGNLWWETSPCVYGMLVEKSW